MLFKLLFPVREESWSQKSLRKALIENKGTYQITRNGSVKTDYNHPKVRSRLEKVFSSLSKIKTEK